MDKIWLVTQDVQIGRLIVGENEVVTSGSGVSLSSECKYLQKYEDFMFNSL
ncbi:hypothetical protein [Paenibacillus polymyxa]|uniref:Uncharacterized protein n=1 Tax=Paenibacillus polymyxa TaxID=1406 RepID=A0AAP4EDV9_PAEPO|nr:hypothetical protein [Paenibacillus polymyxa]MDH2334326.1 hypothetical protein [Paenibacillus polymyxa]